MELAPIELSLQIAAIATLVTLVVGVALATLLAWKKMVARDFVDALVTAPMVLPPTVLGYYLLVSLGKHSALGRWYEAITGAQLLFTVKGCIIASAIGSLPLVVKSARSALSAVDPTVVLAARTLGAAPLRAFFTVKLPLAASGVIAGVMLGFARGLGDFGLTLMIGGDIPGETQTAALNIYSSWQAGDDTQMTGMVLALTAFAIAVLWVVNRLTRGRGVL